MIWISHHRDFILYSLFMLGNYGAFWIGRWSCIKDHYPEADEIITELHYQLDSLQDSWDSEHIV